MATKAKPVKKKAPDILEEVSKGDMHDLVSHVKTYPVWYAAAVVFLMVCVAIGVAYRSAGSSSGRTDATAMAKALQNEDPVLRAEELKPVAEGNGPKAAEALYHMGHAYLAAKNYPEAKDAFEKLRAKTSEPELLASAVEGLGLVAENEKDYNAALAYYKEIVDKWPNTLVRHRQGLHMARVNEELGNYADAVAAYQSVKKDYPAYAQDAQKALDRLEKSHPELFVQAEESTEPAGQPEAAVPPVDDVPETSK